MKFHIFLFLQKIRKQSDEWKKRYDEQLIAFEQKQHERKMKVERKKASTDLVCLRRDALVNSHLKVSSKASFPKREKKIDMDFAISLNFTQKRKRDCVRQFPSFMSKYYKSE